MSPPRGKALVMICLRSGIMNLERTEPIVSRSVCHRLSLLFAVVALPVRAQTPPAVERYFALTRPAFSGDRARDVVAFMDRYFRLPGNTGFDASIHHVEEILTAAGYVNEARARTGDRLTYRVEHRPRGTPAWDVEDASVTIVGEREPLLRYATNKNMLAINSYSTPDTGVVADVVDVGSGAAADYDRANVAGKIVLANGGAGRTFSEAVQRRGALGVFSYGLPDYNQAAAHPHSIQFTSIAFDSVRKSWGIPLSLDAVERLRAALSRGPTRVRVITRTRLFPADELTLIAEVRGSVNPQERFVLSAHVQEPGANDNASGVGALAEMARTFGVLLAQKKIDPRRSITMIFGNEISQTRNYLAADTARTRRVLWGLSLDMVGEDTRKTGGTFLIEKMPDPSAVWTRGDDHHTEWGGRALTKDRIRPHYFNDFLLARCLDQAATTGWVVKTNPYEGGSDHSPFLDFGRPGALFWHFTDVYYHTDGDRLEMVSPATIANVGNAALVSVLTLTSADGATTRALVAELERAARKRLDTESGLSRRALAAGGDRARETEILEAWKDYYVKAIEAMRDIEVGGASRETQGEIDAAANRIRGIAPLT
jgi:aminopeptidase YwaD